MAPKTGFCWGGAPSGVNYGSCPIPKGRDGTGTVMKGRSRMIEKGLMDGRVGKGTTG